MLEMPQATNEASIRLIRVIEVAAAADLAKVAVSTVVMSAVVAAGLAAAVISRKENLVAGGTAKPITSYKRLSILEQKGFHTYLWNPFLLVWRLA
jgi:predicted nicotinamide N-methyase